MVKRVTMKKVTMERSDDGEESDDEKSDELTQAKRVKKLKLMVASGIMV